MSTFITTYTGRRFYPLDPNPADVCIEDIAHALSMVCRFNGHVRSFYSVAEHSVHVSRIVPPEYALVGLLHDASEAYIADVSKPVKYTAHMASYRAVEENLMLEIWRGFSLHMRAWWDVDEVKDADARMLALEARTLLPYDPWMDDLPANADVKLGLWSPYGAERAFMERFAELTT